MRLLNRIADNPVAERAAWGVFAMFFSYLNLTAKDSLLQFVVGIGFLGLSIAYFIWAAMAYRTQNSD